MNQFQCGLKESVFAQNLWNIVRDQFKLTLKRLFFECVNHDQSSNRLYGHWTYDICKHEQTFAISLNFSLKGSAFEQTQYIYSKKIGIQTECVD